jgi:Fe-S cluster assembly iron-binding protein IscA
VLTLTESAATEIRQLIEDPELPAGAGLRIANDPASGGMSLAVAMTPAAEDRVVEEAGARVFLEPGAAALLDDKALDAGTDSAGQVQFRIADPAE